MSVSYVRAAMPGDTWLLLPTVRQPDIDELAALGHTPEECMRAGMQFSFQTWTQFIHDEPACMYGVTKSADSFVPWCVATTMVDEYPIPFLRESRRFIKALRVPLVNYVDARKVKTMDWLAWLGFTIDPPVVAGIHGELFHRFHTCAG
jgi:hypothetical protein